METGVLEGESQPLPSPRTIDIILGNRKHNDTEVTLYMPDSKGERRNLNQLILPEKGQDWKIIQGDGNIIISCDSDKKQVRIPEYSISIDSDFGHDYEPADGSKIDIGEFSGVEAHSFLKLDGAGYSLLHEAGHAFKDKEIEDDLEWIYEARDKPVEKWDETDYQVYKYFVIPMEVAAWDKADELDKDLLALGINLEPNWDIDRKRRQREHALESYYSALREYEQIKQ